MSKETITQNLLRRLDASYGMHSQIAHDTGVAQATISRIYLRKVSPRLNIAEPILAWFDKRDSAAAAKASRVSRRRAATTSALRK